MESPQRKFRVLIVDDEPDACETLEALLYREGYELLFASSGIQAIDDMDSLAPDVILLDVMMPTINGFEVCQYLKNSQEWRHVPIILITALDSLEELARGLNAGADEFLTKPVKGMELRARVRSMLRIKRQYDELGRILQMRETFSNMIVHDMRNDRARYAQLACRHTALRSVAAAQAEQFGSGQKIPGYGPIAS